MVELKKLWFFAGWSHLSQERRKLIIECKTTDVVLGLNTNPKKFKFYNKEQIIDDCKWLQQNDICSHIMPWVNRTDSFLTDMCNDIYELLEELQKSNIKVNSVLLDTEKHWLKNTYKVKDFIKHNEDAVHEYIVPFRDKIKKDFDTELGTTSLLKIPEAVKRLAEISDYTIPQAYSVWFPTDKNHWSHDYIFTPVVSQKEAFECWNNHSKKIVMGLGCYYEERPGWTQERTLRKCLNTTLELGIDEVAYWDLKHCVGKGKKKEIRRTFIGGLLNKVRDGEFDRADWITLQKALDEFHFNPGPLDGIFGPMSMKALDDFRKNFDLKRNVDLNIKDLITLLDNYCF